MPVSPVFLLCVMILSLRIESNGLPASFDFPGTVVFELLMILSCVLVHVDVHLTRSVTRLSLSTLTVG